MMGVSWKTMLVIIVCILVLLIVKNSRADMLQDYNSEVVEYIQTKHRILPANTKFKCVDCILYKNGYVQRMYTGKAQTCETIEMTRGDYENYIILTLF